MRNKIVNGLTGLLLPFAAYSATPATYGNYQQRKGGQDVSHLSSKATKAFDARLEDVSQIRDEDQLTLQPGTVTRELIIVDSSVKDKQLILEQAGPGVAIVEITAGDDGVDGLLRALEGFENLSAVHIVAHGESGALFLGGHRVDQQALIDNVSAFATINQAIREGGDLMLYGCDLAQGEAGEDFLSILQNNTHVDVAASDDRTGNEAYGGNWDLEIQKGSIETAVLADTLALKDFSSVLFNGTIDFSQTKDAGVYCGAASDNAEVWTSAGQEYYLIVDGANHGTDLYTGTSSIGQAAYTCLNESSVTLRFNGTAPFSPQSLRVANIHSNAHTLTFTSSKGSFALAFDGVSGPNNVKTVDLTPLGANITGITISSDRVYANFENFSVADVGVSANNAPTDISLDSTTINANVTGAGAVIGNLGTTDADGGDTHTYSLVSNGASGSGSCGASGDDDNASFQVDNANDDLETSGSLSPGAYNVCIQTSDGTDTFQKSFSISVPVDSDGGLTAAGGVTEPVGLDTTAASVAAAVDVFDFTLSDGGTSDGLAMDVSQVTVSVSGTSTDAERSNITWRLNGPDVSNVPGTYDAGADTITFSSLSISIADGGNETYTINAYYNDNTGLTEDHTVVLSVDGDTDLTVGGSGTQMGATSAVTNGTGTSIDVMASQLAFTTQPAGSVSGSALSTQPVVTAQDGFGNTDVDFTETITLTEASAGSLTNNTQAAASGVATFTGLTYTATADQESFTLTANDQDGVGSNLSTVDANAVTSDVVATKLIFDTQPAPTTVSNGVATNFTTVPVVRAVDGNDITDTGYSTGIALAEVNGAGSATLTGTGDIDGSGATVTLTPSSGAATFSGLQATYTVSGSSNETFNLQASSGGLTTADSTQLTASVTPTVSSVSVPANATYVAGQNLDFTINASQNITVNTSGGTPRIALDISGSTVYADYLSGSGTSALTFRYTLQTGDLDTDGIGVGALETNGGTLQDGSGNDLDTTLNSVGDTTAILVDAVDPTVSSVSVPAAGHYVAGENLDFTLNASENVTINTGGGTPRIPLTVGATTRYADYSSGSGTSSIVFRYTVQSGGEDTDGIAVAASVDANGGTLKDAAGNDLNTTLNAVGDTGGIVVDAIAPAGHSVSFDDSTLNSSEVASVSFTFAAAEVGTDYSYTISSSGGGTPVTGSGTIASAGEQISGLDLSGLPDGTLTLSVTLSDSAGNTASAVTDTATLDATVPTGHSVSFDDGTLSSTEADSASFTFAGAEVGTDYSYSISSSGGGTVVTGSGTIATATDQISAIDLSGLNDGTLTLSVTLTDTAGNSASPVTDTASLDVAAPDGQGVSFDDDLLNSSEAGAASFTFSGAEVGADYSYTISGSSGTPVTGSGTIAVAGEQITGLDVSGLADGTLTLSATLTDAAGNSADAVTDTTTLDTAAPAGYGVGFDEADFNAADATAVSFTFSSAEVGADYSYEISSSGGGTLVTGTGTLSDGAEQITGVDVSGLGDGTLTLSVELTDEAGNATLPVTDTATLDATQATVGLSSPAAAVINGAFDVAVTFDEDVSGFDESDITVSNATLSNFASTGTGDIYSVTVTPTDDGAVTVDVAAGVAQDAAGNDNTAATQLIRTFDGTAPAPVVSSDAAAGVTNAPIELTVDFGEAVTGFVAGSLSVTNGSVTGFTDTGNGLYELTVEAAGDGDVTLEVPAGVADDEAGNASEASNAVTVAFDASGPELQSSEPSSGASAVSYQSDLTLTFDEPVFAVTGDLVLRDATEGVEHTRLDIADGNVVITGSQVAVSLDDPLVPTHDYYVTVAAGSLEDEAGNLWSGILNDTTLSFTVGNEAPQANNDTAEVRQDRSVAIDLLANDTDLEGDLSPASVRVTGEPLHGRVSINPGTGVATYTPEPGFSGSDSFAYRVEDQFRGESNVATVSVDVTAEVQPPVAGADVANGAPGDTVVFDLLANDSAGAGGSSLDNLTLTLVNRPLNGSAEVVGGELTYTPEEGFSGVEQLRYTLTDPDGRVSNVADVWINLSESNQPPVTADDTADTDAGTAVTLDILVNDSDPDGSLDPASVRLTSLAAHGSVSLDATTGELTYTPDEGFRGEDRITYVVGDDAGAVSGVAEVTLSVGLNEAPVARNDQVRLVGDDVQALSVLGNDGNGLAPLVPASLQVVDAPAQGVVSVDAITGQLLYTPDDGFTGTDELTYTVEDDQGRVSAPATVVIGTGVINNPPLANPDRFVLAEDSSLSLDLLGNDQDLEGSLDPANITLVSEPQSGQASVEGDGSVVYTPDQNFFGDDRLTYRVSDASGAESRLVRVDLRVTPVADVPLISGSPTRTVPAEESYRFTPVAKDIDGNPLQFSIANKPAWASFDAATGRLSGTPEANQAGLIEGIVISVSNGDESASLPAFDLQVVDNSGGEQDAGDEPVNPTGPGEEEESPLFRVDPDNPQLAIPDNGWPALSDGSSATPAYRIGFIDQNGRARSVSVIQGEGVSSPVSSGPDSEGRLGLEFSQSNGSRQQVSIAPDGETEVVVYDQAGDPQPASQLTSRASELESEVDSDGHVTSRSVIQRTSGGEARVEIIQSPDAGVTVSVTVVTAEGEASEATQFQFDLVPATIDLAADGVVNLEGQTVNSASETVRVRVRLDTRGGMTAVSTVDDGTVAQVSGIVTEIPGGIGNLDAAASLMIVPDQDAPPAEAVIVDSLGVLSYEEDGTLVTEPGGGSVVLGPDGINRISLDTDPDGNGLRRAAEVSRSGPGDQPLSRLEITDVEGGNADVFVEEAEDGNGFLVRRNLSDGTLQSRVRLDGSAEHRLFRNGQPDNEVTSSLPDTLSIFFEDRAVTVADQGDSTFYVEALTNGQVRHEVVRGGNSTRASSRLPGTRTRMESVDGGAQVITEADREGRQIRVTARSDGSAQHRLSNRAGKTTEAEIRVPGTSTTISGEGELTSRVRLGDNDVCAWVATFSNGESSTGFGRYDQTLASCVGIASPTNLDSAFESGNSVSVDEVDGSYSITIEADLTRPIRF